MVTSVARVFAGSCAIAALCSVLLVLSGASPLWANPQLPPDRSAQGPLVIHSDHGGKIGARQREVERLAATGRRVEVRGRCLSACTLYLGLENVCVTPQAILGFHGPTWQGRALSPREFERWSHLLAAAYKPPLKRWYLEVARYQTTEPILLRGSALIRLGYAAC